VPLCAWPFHILHLAGFRNPKNVACILNMSLSVPTNPVYFRLENFNHMPLQRAASK